MTMKRFSGYHATLAQGPGSMGPRNFLLRVCAASAPGCLIVLLAACSGPTPSVIEGQALYRANGCTSCHGPSGHGDGPMAATLPSRLPDLHYPASLGLLLINYIVAKHETHFSHGSELIAVQATGTEDVTRREAAHMNPGNVPANEEASVLKGRRRGD